MMKTELKSFLLPDIHVDPTAGGGDAHNLYAMSNGD